MDKLTPLCDDLDKWAARSWWRALGTKLVAVAACGLVPQKLSGNETENAVEGASENMGNRFVG